MRGVSWHRLCVTTTGMDDRNPGFAHGRDIRDRAFAFACRIVKFCQKLYEVGGVARHIEANALVSIMTAIVGNTRANTQPMEKNSGRRSRAYLKVIPNS